MSKSIYILLSRLPNRGSKVFGLFSGEYYTHASIGLMEDKKRFYSFQMKGFVEENIEKYIDSGKASYECEVYSISVSRNKYKLVKKLLNEFSENRADFSYTKLGLALSILRIPYIRKNYYFCSHFVAEILKQSKVANLEKSTCLYLPEHLKKLPEAWKIYSGDVKNWCYT